MADTSLAPYDGMKLTVIALTAVVGVVQAAPMYNEDPCLDVCWEFLPKCLGGMYSNNKGSRADPCWTCCRAQEYDSGSEVTFAMQTNTCLYRKS